MDDDESMIDEYLDAAGMVRTFRLTVHAGGRFLEAIERRGAAWAGLRFLLPVPAGEPPPWGEMRAQIRAWLARRDVARHPRSGRLELVAGSLRGQIASVGDDGEPKVLVDDLEIAWSELGGLLASYEGWHIRIEIRDPSEGLRLTPATRVVSRADLPVVICVVDTPQYRTGWWPAVSPPPSAASSCSVSPGRQSTICRSLRARLYVDLADEASFSRSIWSGRSTQRADACRSAPSSARDPSRAPPTTVKIRARVARPPHERARCLAASCQRA